MENEQWRDINGYEGWYQVSNLGRVKSLDRIVDHVSKNGLRSSMMRRGHIFKLVLSTAKYPTTTLSKHSKIKKFLVHRLVAEAFIPKIEGKDIVNHKDSNPQNSHVSNLEWCTYSENNIHAMESGRSHLRILDHTQVKTIRSIYRKTHIKSIDLANYFKISFRQLRRIANGYSYSHIK